MDRGITIAAGAVFGAYAWASLLWSSDPLWGAIYLGCLTAGIPLAYIPNRLLWQWFVTGTIVMVVAMLVIEPWFELNPNYLGCIVAMAFAGALTFDYSVWITLPALSVGLAFAQSRGAVIAAGCAGMIWLWKSSRLRALIALVIALALAFFAFGRGGDSLLQRLGIWQDTSTHLWVWGHGFGAFYNDYWDLPIHTNATLMHAPHAYNDALELLFLLGLGLIPLWFFIMGFIERANFQEGVTFVTFCVLGLSYFPLFIFPINTMLVATMVQAILKEPYNAMATGREALPQRSRY